MHIACIPLIEQRTKGHICVGVRCLAPMTSFLPATSWGDSKETQLGRCSTLLSDPNFRLTHPESTLLRHIKIEVVRTLHYNVNSPAQEEHSSDIEEYIWNTSKFGVSSFSTLILIYEHKSIRNTTYYLFFLPDKTLPKKRQKFCCYLKNCCKCLISWCLTAGMYWRIHLHCRATCNRVLFSLECIPIILHLKNRLNLSVLNFNFATDFF